jgi:hypothetical protein
MTYTKEQRNTCKQGWAIFFERTDCITMTGLWQQHGQSTWAGASSFWSAAKQTREAYQWWNFPIDGALLVWSVATVQQWQHRLLWVATSNSVVVVVAPASTILSLHSATTTAAKDNNNGNRSNKQAWSSLRIVVNYTTSLKIICKNLRK